MTTYLISTYATVRSRTYYTNITVDSASYRLSSSCWILDQLNFLKSKSELNALARADMALYIRALEILSKDEITHSLINLKAEQTGRKEIYRLFILLEQLLVSYKTTPEVRCKCSSVFRKLVLIYAKCHKKFKEEVSQSTLGFKTKFGRRAAPRALISDVKNLQIDPELAAPISALSHTDAKDLLQKTELRLERDLELIQQACISQLRVCESLRDKLTELEKNKYSRIKIQSVEILLIESKHKIVSAAKVAEKLPANELLGIIQQIIRRRKLAYVDREYNPIFWFSAQAIESLLSDTQKHLSLQRYRLHYLPYRIISEELISCFVLLLTHTGWNSSTLLHLSVDDVTVGDNFAILKGYKSKTDRYVPDVYLDSKHIGALTAIKLILWNHSQLIKLGFLAETSKWLWCTWTNKYGPLEFQYIGFQDGLRRLQHNYSLPSFSLEQIRPQVLAYETLRMRNPEHVRQLASHQNLATTGHYLDQLLTRSMNSAINLEFQRRLENTVLFRLSEADKAFAAKVKLKHVDLKLLVPIGDGSSCENPTSPPDDSYMIGNLCEGKMCHSEEGCPNRKIILDHDNLVALVRKRRYYLSNWRRLEQANDKAFEKFHVPAILFTLGLYDYVKNSSFKHHLDRVEREVANGNQKN